MRKVIMLIVFGTAAVAYAQTGHVEQLSPQDASEAKTKWETLQKAQADWDKFHAAIRDKYLDAKDGPSECFGNVHFKQGWGCGEFEFTPDMRFIVPKHIEMKPWPSNSCFAIAPAVQQ